MKRIEIRLPDEDAAALSALAADGGVSTAIMCREIVRRGLEVGGQETDVKEAIAAAIDQAALADDISQRIDDALSDLRLDVQAAARLAGSATLFSQSNCSHNVNADKLKELNKMVSDKVPELVEKSRLAAAGGA